MIRLQKDDLESNDTGLDLNLTNNNETRDLSIDENDTNIESVENESLESFSQKVFDTLLDKNIPLLPLNYQVYFEQMLNDTSQEFQKKVHSLIESNTNNDDRNINFEKNIHSAFANTRDILKCTSSIYKNLVLMNETEKKWHSNLLTNNTNSQRFINDTEILQNDIDEQINQLKILYQKCTKILENINTNTMYDSKFDTYNKRYFIYLVQNEQKMIEKFRHTSTIIMLTLTNQVIQYIKNDQAAALIIMKTIAKLLLKTSRRSDIIGYVGNGIFSMLLKHSDIIVSQRASERLIELIKSTNVFLGKREINLDLNIGIAKMNTNRSAENSLNFAINALRLAQQSKTPYIVYKDDVESN